MTDDADKPEIELDADGREVNSGRFAKGWKGGPGRPHAYSKRRMQELVVNSMDARGDRIARALAKGPNPERVVGGAQEYVDSLSDTMFVPHLLSKLMPKEMTLDGDGEGGPVQINIIHYGHKPEESEAQTPDEETNDGLP